MRYVYLAPSVNRYLVGYGSYGSEEQRMNLITDIIEYELMRHDIKTARCEPEMTLYEAVADSNAKGCDIYISLKSQQANGKLSGCEIFYRGKDNQKRLANDIALNLKVLIDVKEMEGQYAFGGLSYYELTKTKAPSVIVNMGYHDNPKDAKLITDKTYELGCAVSKGVLDYYGIVKKEDSKVNIINLMASYNGVTF